MARAFLYLLSGVRQASGALTARVSPTVDERGKKRGAAFHFREAKSTAPSDKQLRVGKSMVRATDAKEVGVENPAEETCCHPNQSWLKIAMRPPFVNSDLAQENRIYTYFLTLGDRPPSRRERRI